MPLGFSFDNSTICIEDGVVTTSAIDGIVAYVGFGSPPEIQNSLQINFYDSLIDLGDDSLFEVIIDDETLGKVSLELLDIRYRDDQSNITNAPPFLEADISFRVTIPNPNDKIPEGLYDIPLVFRVENDEGSEELRVPIQVKVVYKTIDYWIAILNGLC